MEVGAKLSFRSRRQNVPEVFIFKPNIVIFEARIIAIPRLPLSEMKYIPIRKDLPTLCPYAQPLLDPPGKLLTLAMLSLQSPFFCH